MTFNRGPKAGNELGTLHTWHELSHLGAQSLFKSFESVVLYITHLVFFLVSNTQRVQH